MIKYTDIGFRSILKRKVLLAATQTTVKQIEVSALDRYIKRSEDAWKFMIQSTMYRYFKKQGM